MVGRGLLVLLALAYPVAIYAGLSVWNTRMVAGTLGVAVLTLGLIRLRRADSATRWAVLAPPAAIALLVVAALWSDDRRFILAMPVLVNIALLVAFATTLRGPVSMIQRYAMLVRPELTDAEIAHCRQATVAWCVFFVGNGAIAALLALWAPLSWWTLYTGAISYGLMGVLFAAELVVRRVRFGQYGPGPLDRLLCAVLPPPTSPDPHEP